MNEPTREQLARAAELLRRHAKIAEVDNDVDRPGKHSARSLAAEVAESRALADLIESQAAEIARLREALQELIAIDDGDDPGLWGYEPMFAKARAALASVTEHQEPPA